MEYWHWMIKTKSYKNPWQPFPYLASEDGKLTNGKPIVYNGIPWAELVKQKIGVKFIMTEKDYSKDTIQ